MTAIIHPHQARTRARADWQCARFGTRSGYSSTAFWAAQAAASVLQAIVMEESGDLWDPRPITATDANSMARELRS